MTENWGVKRFFRGSHPPIAATSGGSKRFYLGYIPRFRLLFAVLASSVCLSAQTISTNPGIATAAAPVYGEGQRRPVSLDLAGNQRIIISSGTVTVTQGSPPWTFDLTRVGGTVLSGANVVDAPNTAFRVNCVTGCVAGGSFTDNTAFTAGGTAITNVGGVFNDALAAVTAGNAAAPRITDRRAFHVNLRNVAGTEVGTAGAPLRTDPTGATTQPVSGTVTSNQGGVWTVTSNQGGAWTVTANQGGAPWTFTSTKSNNAVIPGATNLGTLPCIANAAEPLWTEGNQVACSVDLAGRVRFNLSSWLGSTAPTVGQKAMAASLPVVIASDQSAVPVSGTVTVGTFPDNEPINVAQINSVTPLMGNGVTGTGSQRVTIASDNTAFTVNVGTFPDNEPVNVAQMNGVAVSMGAGIVGTGVQRVVLANNEALPPGTNNIGDVDVLTFPDNEPINVAQMNGVAVTMGNGVSGTGVQRSVNASDNSAIANWGHGAIGAAPPSGGVQIDGLGSGLTGGQMRAITICDTYANINQTGNTQVITGVAARRIYICALNLVTATAQNVAVVAGTGVTCATTTVAVPGTSGGTTAATGWNFAANGGIVLGTGLGAIAQTTVDANNLCIFQSGAGQLSGGITYAIY